MSCSPHLGRADPAAASPPDSLVQAPLGLLVLLTPLSLVSLGLHFLWELPAQQGCVEADHMLSHLPNSWPPLLTQSGNKFDFGFNLIAKVLKCQRALIKMLMI